MCEDLAAGRPGGNEPWGAWGKQQVEVLLQAIDAKRSKQQVEVLSQAIDAKRSKQQVEVLSQAIDAKRSHIV